MLELLVKGLLLWAYDLILECVSFIGDVLLDVFRMDTAYFKEHAPVVVELQHIFIGTGWALLLGNLVSVSYTHLDVYKRQLLRRPSSGKLHAAIWIWNPTPASTRAFTMQ